MSSQRLAATLALSLFAFGCSDGTRACPDCDGGRPASDASLPPSDSSTSVDGALRDGAVPDGALPDGAPPRDSGAADTGVPTPTLPFCQLGCATSSDCTTPSAAFDADNYACEETRCRYTGCNDDAECQSTFMNSDYLCREVSGLNTCVEGCAVEADCGTASAAFDADNYRCSAGHCEYQGCNDDAECASTFLDARYVCRDVDPPDRGLPIPVALRNCVLGCSVASDCSTSSAAFDADNYECRESACRYTGCNDDAECAGSFSDARYVCR